MSLLIAKIGETVSVETLIDELWAKDSPRSARTTLQTYVYHARRMLTDLGVAEPEAVLVTRSSGYAIVADHGDLDATAFRRLVATGARQLTDGEPELAAASLSDALRLSRGPAFAGMTIGPVLEGHATYLDELRLNAVSLRIEALRRLGYHRELIPELRSLVSENPLNESFHALLIGALSDSGRRAEALQAYQRVRRILDVELGVCPGPEIQQLYTLVLG